MNDFIFSLGSEVKDVITGYKGYVRGRAQYLTGCNTYAVQRKGLDKDGKVHEWKWFDENQLELIKENAICLPKQQTTKYGGANDIDQIPPSN